MESVIRTASVQEIKEELVSLPPAKIVELCLRLARFKKENKELLNFLLFEAHNIPGYIAMIRQEIEIGIAGMNSSNLYFAKKTIRKVLRMVNKHTRFSGSKQVETELLIHFCQTLADTKIPIKKNQALFNLYQGQLKKARKAAEGLHEDLQYEYLRQLERLEIG